MTKRVGRPRMKGPKKKRYTMTMYPWIVRRGKALARKHHMTLSAWVSMLMVEEIMEYADEVNPKKGTRRAIRQAREKTS